MRTVTTSFVAGLVALVIAGCGAAAVSSPAGSQRLPTATPSPASTSETVRTPRPVASGEIPMEGQIPAGTYVMDRALGVSIVIPAGWSSSNGVINKGDFAGLGVADVTEITVYAEPCTWKTGGQSEPRGAAAIAAALAAQHGREASAVGDASVGGLPGRHVRLMVPADQQVISDLGHYYFTGCDDGEFRSWSLADGGARHHQGAGQIDDLYFVDVEGHTVVFDVVSGPRIEASDKAELDAMLASVHIG